MSYPKRLDLFKKWAQAMVNGATVGKENYSPAAKTSRRRRPKPKRKFRKTRRLRRRHFKMEE